MVFQVLQDSSLDLSRSNYVFITLLLKKASEPMVKYFHTISTEKGIIKLILKFLSTSLSKVIDSLVTQSQTTFIKEQLIFQSYITASEVLSHCKRIRAKGILCKVDFEKAFDSISWKFLLDVISN